MLALDKLESQFFAPLIGQHFSLTAENTAVDLELVEVTANEHLRRASMRAPFALLFRAASGEVFSQRIFRLDHVEIGAMEFFLVPVRRDETGSYYEAVFN